MAVLESRVKTAAASKYLQQLCPHFAHKIEVQFTPESGRADFEFGVCTMRASGSQPHIVCEAQAEESVRKVQGVMHSHLERFAWREKPEIVWRPV